VFADNDSNNPSGESLPSELFTINLPAIDVASMCLMWFSDRLDCLCMIPAITIAIPIISTITTATITIITTADVFLQVRLTWDPVSGSSGNAPAYR
jgi:hypothetical protein